MNEERKRCHVRVRPRDRDALAAMALEISRRDRVRASLGDAVRRLLAHAAASGDALWRARAEDAPRDRTAGTSAPVGPRAGGRGP
ncbi:MAG TPA: hypothetical protein VM889_02470 [Candidatus Thermoplasmatota archaeon]|nr:hypothetical protein [Candidatus Thermoplasmatota archaeon]